MFLRLSGLLIVLRVVHCFLQVKFSGRYDSGVERLMSRTCDKRCLAGIFGRGPVLSKNVLSLNS